MDKFYYHVLHNMESILESLAKRVSPPQRAPILDCFVFRYSEKSINQAIVQKLARVISGLYATHILLEHGFIQEQAALQRMLGEFQEDVTFLAFAVTFNDVTDLHRKYLNAFYEEEFDKPEDPVSSTQKRLMVPRDKIRSYIDRIECGSLNLNTGVVVTRTIGKTYSGYVHGASPQTMEMYGENPPKFHVAGWLGSPLYLDHKDDLWNYFYRGICVFGFAAKAFGDDALSSSIQCLSDEFVRQSGRQNDIGQMARPSHAF